MCVTHTPAFWGSSALALLYPSPMCLGPVLHPLSSALSPGSWVVNPALTVHPGIRTQGANAGRGLGGVGNGLAGGPSVKIDVDGHRRAGEHQEPDDGQDVGNAHKLQGAGQTRAEPWLPSGRGHGQGSARFPRQGRPWGRWGDCDAACAQLSTACQTQRVPRQAAQDSSLSWGLLQLTGPVPVPDSRPAVNGGDQQQQDGCHVSGGDNRAHGQAGFGLCGRTAAKAALACQRGSPALPPWCHPNQPPREPQPCPSAPPGHRTPLPALCHGSQAQQRGRPQGYRVP